MEDLGDNSRDHTWSWRGDGAWLPASGPMQSTLVLVKKCGTMADSATELLRAASPGLFCQFWGGCDRINPKPAFSAAVE